MRSSTRTIRIAAVGLGWVSTNRHLPAMRRNPAIEIVGAIDRRGGRAEAVARRFRLRRSAETDSLERIDWIDEIDAVVIGAPPQAHFGLARSALSLGKHVLVEKPFAMDPDEGAEMGEIAARNRLTLAVVHNFQFASSSRRLLCDITSGRLGTIRSIVARQYGNPKRRLPSWYDQLPLGLFYDESPHLLYLMRRFSPGALKLVHAQAMPSTIGLRTPASLDVLFAGSTEHRQIPVSMSMYFESPVSEWFLSVLGDEGAGIIDLFRDIYVFLPNDGQHTTRTVLRTSLAATWQHWSQHFTSGLKHSTGRLSYGNDEIIRRFVEAIQTGSGAADIGPDDAIAVLQMQHAIVSACAVPA